MIDKISPHTEKKFELVAAYAKEWACVLLEHLLKQSNNHKEIAFIDCMCNSGTYEAKDTRKPTEGTPVRVAEVLSKIMQKPKYESLHARCYFNDSSSEKIEELKKHMPKETKNFHLEISVGDGNECLKRIMKQKDPQKTIHYLVFYDPYDASIDWEALTPFIQSWSDIIINHMVSDTIRNSRVVICPETQEKYERTYKKHLTEISNCDRKELERRIEEIIKKTACDKHSQYYVPSFPFYNTRKALVYNLVLATGSKKAFNVYKEKAWKTFGGYSSGKNSVKNTSDPGQLEMFSSSEIASRKPETAQTDEDCLGIEDIVNYVIEKFRGSKDVKLDAIWAELSEHPIFPSTGFRKEIKDCLQQRGCIVYKNSIDFLIPKNKG